MKALNVNKIKDITSTYNVIYFANCNVSDRGVITIHHGYGVYSRGEHKDLFDICTITEKGYLASKQDRRLKIVVSSERSVFVMPNGDSYCELSEEEYNNIKDKYSIKRVWENYEYHDRTGTYIDSRGRNTGNSGEVHVIR